MKNLRVACAALFSLMIIVAGCNKSSNTTSVPFQGPQNPSFETLGSWYVTYTASGGTYQGGSFVDIVTGTGFLPSAGTHYLNMTTYNVFNPAPEATVYQDSIDLTHSKTLTFDYAFTGTLGAYGGTATVQVLFTSNGTATLWTKVIDSTYTLPVQMLAETIVIPATTVPGRLTISLNAVGGLNPHTSPSTVTETNIAFGIDNISVK